MAIKTFDGVEAALEPFIRFDSKGLTTRATKDLAQFVGSPEERLKVIHVAGTSGKTSTCYYIRALLEEAGQKTGLTVSPHMVSIADRVQVAGEPLSEAVFCRYFDEYFGLVQQFNGRPSYFEIMMVFALWVFDREQVDYAVIETGLGGLHDSSNICRRPDKVCVLTDIGIDHTQVLGSSIGEITRQKVGIVTPGNKLIMYSQGAEISLVVEKFASSINYAESPRTHDFGIRNLHLAQEVYRFISERDGLGELSEAQTAKVQQVQIPGRLEVFWRDGIEVILDGAHNQQKMAALVRALAGRYPGQKFAVVLAMKRGREFREVIELLQSIAQIMIVSRFGLFQDTNLGAISEDTLLARCRKLGMETESSQDLEQALTLALKKASAQQIKVLVTGSLYAVSEVRCSNLPKLTL